ncbi:MAG: hypothetical protein U9N73_03315, partial [Candidatus Auribacterota bacterium]|nr:hypothetical protein [Candidatus Auribacterota bacterium]
GLPEKTSAPSPPVSGQEEHKVPEEESSSRRSIREIWPEFMETLGENKGMLKAYLMEGVPGEIEDGILKVYFKEEFDFHREALESPNKQTFMENLLSNKLGFPVKLQFVLNQRTGEDPGLAKIPSPSRVKKKSLIRDNPIIEVALEIFDATIEDVRE